MQSSVFWLFTFFIMSQDAVCGVLKFLTHFLTILPTKTEVTSVDTFLWAMEAYFDFTNIRDSRKKNRDTGNYPDSAPKTVPWMFRRQFSRKVPWFQTPPLAWNPKAQKVENVQDQVDMVSGHFWQFPCSYKKFCLQIKTIDHPRGSPKMVVEDGVDSTI